MSENNYNNEEGDDIFDDDIEMVEKGLSHNIISPNILMYYILLYRPLKNNNKWKKFFIFKTDEENVLFKLYDFDDIHFYLTAIKNNNSILFSQYSNIKKNIEFDGKYCAKLIRISKNHFSLYNNGCEICDNKLKLFTCSNQYLENRQKLLDIIHFEQIIPNTLIICRQMKITLPKVYNYERSCWCPRYINNKQDTSLYGLTLLPRYDKEINKLVLNYSDSREIIASKKNFVMQIDNKIVLEFSKYSENKYLINIKYPMCILQATAICLSNFLFNSNSNYFLY